jgi:hypothetical protein
LDIWVRKFHVGLLYVRVTVQSVHASPYLRRVKHRTYIYAFSITNSLPSFTLTSNTLRSASPLAGLLVQLSANADPPLGWLVLSTFVGLPIALWAYKIRLVEQFQDYHIDR